MAKLIYCSIASLDGYIADEAGNFDWSAPDEEVHAFVNDLQRPVGTNLLGRKMYDIMKVWENPEEFADGSPAIADFAQMWQSSDKVVYSRTLESVSTPRTRLERDFDPEAVRRMKSTVDRDISIGGPNLAARAIGAGLVDEWQLFLCPVVVGGGNPMFPAEANVKLDLREQRRFGNGTVFLRYDTAA